MEPFPALHSLFCLVEQCKGDSCPPLPRMSSLPRSPTEAVAPQANLDGNGSLHRCPPEEPSSAKGAPPAANTLQPVGTSSLLAPIHFVYPWAPHEYRGGSSLPGLGDQVALCSHGSSLNPSPVPSQLDGAWKPPALQHHVVSVR